MMYDRVAAEVNKVCTADCWKNPRHDCPYFCVCSKEALTQSEDEYERTANFEAAIVARYYQLHPEAAI